MNWRFAVASGRTQCFVFHDFLFFSLKFFVMPTQEDDNDLQTCVETLSEDWRELC